MADDISNKTIVVLVILTVIISILGTAVVLNEVGNQKIVLGQKPTDLGAKSGKAQVKFNLVSEDQEPVKPQAVEATGRVTFALG